MQDFSRAYQPAEILFSIDLCFKQKRYFLLFFSESYLLVLWV